MTDVFEETQALLSMYGKAGRTWDPISFSRGSVASRTQDHLRNGFSVLIDVGSDVLLWANENEPRFASRLIGQWIESDAHILRRLSISGMAAHPLLSPDEKLSWAISNRVIQDVGLKNETFALLSQVYGSTNDNVRCEFLEQAKTTMNPAELSDERYQFFNLLSWLHTHAPECELVMEELRPIQERHPQWTVREHPDFNSWSWGVVRVPESDSPIPASQIAEMNVASLIAEGTRLTEAKNSFGDSLKGSFLQEIARTAAEHFTWSEVVAREALTNVDVPNEIWSALLRGWSAEHTAEEWKSVLAIVEQLKPKYASFSRELASLLKASVEQKENELPVELLDTALTLANSVLSSCVAREEPLPDEDDNWINVAINRTTGDLLEFYFGALRSLWQNRAQEQNRIISVLRPLEHTIVGAGPASEIAAIMVAAKIQLLAEINEDWYLEHALPLLAAPATARISEQCWDGYLVWGGWTQGMLPGMIPAYVHHLPEIVGASDTRSEMFCRHLASIAVFGAINPLDNGWLDDFITRSTHRERMHWIGNVTQILREADEQAKESVWNRWFERYLRRRVQAMPLPLDSKESGAMCKWGLLLKSHYAEIVELLLTGPAPSVKGDMFYYHLHETGLLDCAPRITVRLLTALLSQEDGQKFWDLDKVETMVSQLIDLDPRDKSLPLILEQLGRLGSLRALEFQVRLR